MDLRRKVIQRILFMNLKWAFTDAIIICHASIQTRQQQFSRCYLPSVNKTLAEHVCASKRKKAMIFLWELMALISMNWIVHLCSEQAEWCGSGLLCTRSCAFPSVSPLSVMLSSSLLRCQWGFPSPTLLSGDNGGRCQLSQSPFSGVPLDFLLCPRHS